MNLNDDVVYPRLRVGLLHQLHTGSAGGLVCHNDRLHVNCPLVIWLIAGNVAAME